MNDVMHKLKNSGDVFVRVVRNRGRAEAMEVTNLGNGFGEGWWGSVEVEKTQSGIHVICKKAQDNRTLIMNYL